MEMNDGFAAVVRLKIKPEKLDKIKALLADVGEAMSAEKEFVHAWVHHSKDDPTSLVIYEAWSCDIDYFMENLFSKSYRKTYEAEISTALREERNIEVLNYVQSYPGRRG
jgi:quinol monooxygenase YgiN